MWSPGQFNYKKKRSVWENAIGHSTPSKAIEQMMLTQNSLLLS